MRESRFLNDNADHIDAEKANTLTDLRQAALYDTKTIISLFDEMSKTYGITNTLSSFGFSQRWRKKCVSAIDFPEEGRVLDLMSGAGELLHMLYRVKGKDLALTAVDFSGEMVRRARENVRSWSGCNAEVIEADVLDHHFPPNYYDAVISSFGLKTLRDDQASMLSKVVAQTLKPGGMFSLLEISVPRKRILRLPYMFYIKRIIPLIGRLCLGNPENYRFLGVYTEAFGTCESALGAFKAEGLEVRLESFFFGCATALVGHKPLEI